MPRRNSWRAPSNAIPSRISGKPSSNVIPEPYEDLTDRELGRAVKAKYQPLFDDFADLTASPPLRAVKAQRFSWSEVSDLPGPLKPCVLSRFWREFSSP